MSFRTDRHQRFNAAGELLEEVVVQVDTTTETNGGQIRQALNSALAANRADATQAQTIKDQAATLEATTGTRTAAQLSGDVRALAQACRLLANQSIAKQQQVNGLARLLLGVLDGTD